jgi:thiopeptide-type bacteriocin biosynthesis protein
VNTPTPLPPTTPAEPPRVAADWMALHIHLSDPVLATRFLVEWLHPRLRALHEGGRIQRWFYLHYWDGGPHLRVRVQGLAATERPAWQAAVAEATPAWRAPNPPQREAFYGNHGFDGQPVDATALPWFEEGTVRVVDYEPEYRRYGGAPALAVAERLFHTSSELALRQLGAALVRPGQRLAQALRLMPAWGRAVAGDDLAGLAAYFGRYAAFWASYSPQTQALADTLQDTAPLPAAEAQSLAPALGAAPHRLDSASRLLHGALAEARGAWAGLYASGELISPFDGRVVRDPGLYRASLEAIVGSLMHMHHNRLGLVPAQELLLARRAAAAARSLDGAAAAARGLTAPSEAELLS